MSALVAALAALCTYRLTLLVTADDLTAPLRRRAITKLTTVPHKLSTRTRTSNDTWSHVRCTCGDEYTAPPFMVDGRAWWQSHQAHAPKHRDHSLAAVLQCEWCASVWVAIPVAWTAAVYGESTWWLVPALALAASAVTGVLASIAKPG